MSQIEWINEDHKVVLQDGIILQDGAEVDVSEIDEYFFAIYMNHLIDQMRLCWEVITYREAKQ